MTLKKTVLVVAPVLLLAVGAYLGIQFIAESWWRAQQAPLPAISVEAIYPGASAAVIAESVAVPIEQQVNGVERMVSMRSRCGSDGRYSLTVTFKRNTDMDMAWVLVQNRVALALPLIPNAVQNQGIAVKKKSPGFALVVNLSSSDGRFDSIFLSNYATIYLKDELTRLPDVSNVLLVGRFDYRTRIDLDVNRLGSLTAMDVLRNIEQENIQIKGAPGNLAPISNLEKFSDIVLRRRSTVTSTGGAFGSDDRLPSEPKAPPIMAPPDGVIVRLKDVARVELGPVEQSAARFNGKPVTSLFVYPAFQADLRELKSAVDQALARLRERLPDGVTLDIALDFTTNLNRTPGDDHLWIDVALPLGDTRERTREALQRTQKALNTMELVRDVLEMTGPPFAPFAEEGCILVRLTRGSRGETARAEVMQAIRERLAKEVPEATIRLRDLSGTGKLPPCTYPINLIIRGPDPDKVGDYASTLADRLRQSPKLTDVCVNPESVPVPQEFTEIDVRKAGALGIPLSEITETLAICRGTPHIDGIDHLDVRCSTGIGPGKNMLPRLPDIRGIKVRSTTGMMFPLADLVKVSEIRLARAIHRLDMLPMEEITANPAPGISLAEARSLCDSLAETLRQELRLPQEYRPIWP